MVRLLIAGVSSPLLALLLHTLILKIIGDRIADIKPTFIWNLVYMFFYAGLIEECLKYFMCRIAIRKEGMIRTWKDSVISFAIVGITFELIENLYIGMRTGLAASIARALTPAHFIFGVIMGYFYGKYRVTGQKKYHWLCLIVPVVYHTLTNAFLESASLGRVFLMLGIITGVSFLVVAIVIVIMVFHCKKNGKLDIPVSN